MNRIIAARVLYFLWLALLWPTGHLLAYRDLETGTFLSRDPAGMVDGPNFYAYVRQNPWTHFDPEGLYIDEDGPGTGMAENGRILSGGRVREDGRTLNATEIAFINIKNGVGTAADYSVFGKQVDHWGSASLVAAYTQNGLEHREEAAKVSMALGAGIAAVSHQPETGEMALVPGRGASSAGQAELGPSTAKPLTTSAGPSDNTIPARPTLPAFDGKTTQGTLITHEGDVVSFTSGNPDPAYANYPNSGHVEGKSALYIRASNSTGGDLFHNNTNGTCGYCDTMTSTLLSEGARLNVHPPENAVPNNSKAKATSTTYIGNSKVPKPNQGQ